jgi:hypothetical protein
LDKQACSTVFKSRSSLFNFISRAKNGAMNNQTDAWYLDQCLRLIESKIEWGPHTGWTNYDFEKLSEAISDDTGVTLSVSTLKRLWGRVAYKNVPALNTLNTLARFAGYVDWRAFRQNGNAPAQEPVVVEKKPEPTRARRSYYWAMGLLPLIAAIYFLTSLRKHVRTPEPEDFAFNADKMVTSGLPNSVVFHYDATAALNDSVYIVQTWDMRRKTAVPKDKNSHSAIYYYPGFFRTKLLADHKVMRTHDLLVGTDGWLTLVEQDPMPVYFKNDEVEKSGYLEVSKELLGKYNLSVHPVAPKVRFFHMSEMGSLMNDNYTFETSIKNEFDEGTAACQRVEVLIQCKDDIIIIPLSAIACVGDLSLYACGKQLTSKDSDLSAFGCNLNEWNRLKVKTVNKKMTIYVNNREAASFTFPNDPTGIVGVQYRFNGPGAVKDTKFQWDEEEVEF